MRQFRIAQRLGDPAPSPSRYGRWVADFERPAPQYRGRYRLKLDEARQLIAPFVRGG